MSNLHPIVHKEDASHKKNPCLLDSGVCSEGAFMTTQSEVAAATRPVMYILGVL